MLDVRSNWYDDFFEIVGARRAVPMKNLIIIPTICACRTHEKTDNC